MSYRFPVSITIGGPIAEVDIEDLAEAITNDSAGHDWGDYFRSDEEAAEYIREALNSGDRLDINDSESSCGTFDSIESACREMGLTYYRSDSGGGEHGGTGAYWDPDRKRQKEFSVGNDGEPTMSLSAMKFLADKGTNLQEIIAALEIPTIPPLTRATAHRNMERAAAKAREES